MKLIELLWVGDVACSFKGVVRRAAFGIYIAGARPLHILEMSTRIEEFTNDRV